MPLPVGAGGVPQGADRGLRAHGRHPVAAEVGHDRLRGGARSRPRTAPQGRARPRPRARRGRRLRARPRRLRPRAPAGARRHLDQGQVGRHLLPGRALAGHAGRAGDPGDLRLRLSVNDAPRQDGSTGDMLFSVAELLCYVSGLMTLEPGDLVITGTPAGVAMGQPEPRPYLRHGDVVRADGGVLGSHRSRVVDALRSADTGSGGLRQGLRSWQGRSRASGKRSGVTAEVVLRARRAVVGGAEVAVAVSVAGGRIVAVDPYDTDVARRAGSSSSPTTRCCSPGWWTPTSTSTSRAAPTGRASPAPPVPRRPAASRPSSTCRSTRSRRPPPSRPSTRSGPSPATRPTSTWASGAAPCPGNLPDLRPAPRGRRLRVQVLPPALRRRRVPPPVGGRAARGARGDRDVRRARHRARRGRADHRVRAARRTARGMPGSWVRVPRRPRSGPSPR